MDERKNRLKMIYWCGCLLRTMLAVIPMIIVAIATIVASPIYLINFFREQFIGK